MFERYREDARRAIYFAAWEARQSASTYIKTEHLLFGLIHDADSKTNQLFNLAAHAETFRKKLAVPLAAPPLESPNLGDIPLSNASKRVLAYTAEEAYRVGSNPIGTEHLLLGLLREGQSGVPEALAAVGVDLRSARGRIRQDMGVKHIPERVPGREAAPLKSLRPFAAFSLLLVVLSLIYLIYRLVSF
jgi:ATP-dependent Clp protease ATP-binding subunit ClpC